eukprot:5861024-Prymnesium_polylepis.1
MLPSSAATPRAPSEGDATGGDAPPLPAGWEAHADDDGHPFYHCAATGESTYTHPEEGVRAAALPPPLPPAAIEAIGDAPPLPAGWEAHEDDDGHHFYHCAATGESTYARPDAAAIGLLPAHMPPLPAAAAAAPPPGAARPPAPPERQGSGRVHRLALPSWASAKFPGGAK